MKVRLIVRSLTLLLSVFAAQANAEVDFKPLYTSSVGGFSCSFHGGSEVMPTGLFHLLQLKPRKAELTEWTKCETSCSGEERLRLTADFKWRGRNCVYQAIIKVPISLPSQILASHVEGDTTCDEVHPMIDQEFDGIRTGSSPSSARYFGMELRRNADETVCPPGKHLYLRLTEWSKVGELAY